MIIENPKLRVIEFLNVTWGHLIENLHRLADISYLKFSEFHFFPLSTFYIFLSINCNDIGRLCRALERVSYVFSVFYVELLERIQPIHLISFSLVSSFLTKVFERLMDCLFHWVMESSVGLNGYLPNLYKIACLL